MTQKEARDLVQKHGSIRKAAAATGQCRKTITRAYKGEVIHDGKPAHTPTPSAVNRAKGRTLAQFRACYDKNTIVPAKIKAALKALGVGGWEYESQFSKMAMVSLSDLAIFRDQYAEHIVQLKEGRRAWAGSSQTADKMKEML